MKRTEKQESLEAVDNFILETIQGSKYLYLTYLKEHRKVINKLAKLPLNANRRTYALVKRRVNVLVSKGLISKREDGFLKALTPVEIVAWKKANAN